MRARFVFVNFLGLFLLEPLMVSGSFTFIQQLCATGEHVHQRSDLNPLELDSCLVFLCFSLAKDSVGRLTKYAGAGCAFTDDRQSGHVLVDFVPANQEVKH